MSEHPNTERANTPAEANGRGRFLGHARTGFLTAVVALPPVLNAQNIVGWANSPDGLGLPHPWDWTAFAGLDLIAAVCVIETLIWSGRGRKAGAFAALVWAFAFASAYAGYRHGTQPGVGRDVKWFFPFLALAGPVLLHLVLKRRRLERQADDGRRITHAPAGAYGWGRWTPGVGALGETYCAWRVGRLEGIVRPAEAVTRYRALRPDAGWGGLFVLRALRVEDARRRANTGPNTGADQVANVEANTPNTPEPIAANADPNAEQNTDEDPNTEQPEAGSANVRPIGSGRHTPNAKPNTATTDTAKNLKAIKRRYPNWRTEMPSARDCAAVIGGSSSTGYSYQRKLIAERDAAGVAS